MFTNTIRGRLFISHYGGANMHEQLTHATAYLRAGEYSGPPRDGTVVAWRGQLWKVLAHETRVIVRPGHADHLKTHGWRVLLDKQPVYFMEIGMFDEARVSYAGKDYELQYDDLADDYESRL